MNVNSVLITVIVLLLLLIYLVVYDLCDVGQLIIVLIIGYIGIKLDAKHVYTGGVEIIMSNRQLDKRILEYLTTHKLIEKPNTNDLEVDEFLMSDGKSKLTISHLISTAKKAKTFSRILEHGAPVKKYFRRKTDFKRLLHWGQLKLLLTEIEFLTLIEKYKSEIQNNTRTTFIYAGAAPGDHIPYLARLFPNVIFELYDPNDFIVKDTKMIKTHVQFFTDKDAEYWESSKHNDKFIVFCSDIRMEPATEENVQKNMDMQLDWWKIMQPELSMVKFRLPWKQGKTLYPDGDIYIQPFPGPTSTETRLIFKKGAKLIDYDNIKYEEQCFYHNTTTRCMYYDHELPNCRLEKNVDNCYDCASLVNIAVEYLKTYDSNIKLDILIEEIINKASINHHTLLSQTYKSFNSALVTTLCNFYERCEKSRCILCQECSDGSLNKKNFNSKATEENYLQAINK
jgi:hypothetical protein